MTTFDRLQKIIIEHLGVDQAKVTEAATFADLGADSLDLVELMMACEEEFGVDDAADDVFKAVTVADAVALIDRLIPVGPALPKGE